MGRIPPPRHPPRPRLPLPRPQGGKNPQPYLCKIGDCYRREEELLTRQLGASRVTMTWHDGGHATEVPRRMLLGLETLLKTPAL